MYIEGKEIEEEKKMRLKIIQYALHSKNKELKYLSRYVLKTFYSLNTIYNPKTRKEIRLKGVKNENSSFIS